MELAKNLKVGYSSLLALTTRNNGDNSVWKYGTVLDPLTEVYDENGDLRFYNSGWYQTVLHSNPLFDTDKNNVDNKEKRTRILLNFICRLGNNQRLEIPNKFDIWLVVNREWSL